MLSEIWNLNLGDRKWLKKYILLSCHFGCTNRRWFCLQKGLKVFLFDIYVHSVEDRQYCSNDVTWTIVLQIETFKHWKLVCTLWPKMRERLKRLCSSLKHSELQCSVQHPCDKLTFPLTSQFLWVNQCIVMHCCSCYWLDLSQSCLDVSEDYLWHLG